MDDERIREASVVSLAKRVARRTVASWEASSESCGPEIGVEPAEVILARAVLAMDVELSVMRAVVEMLPG
jgi:hypothetical protein